ncbi:MAG: pilus assembly protein [Terricaulis sp.]
MFWRKQRQHFARNRAGVTAIEFAIVAPVFLLALLGTVEVGVAFGAQASLQNSANVAARLVRTGQAQAVALSSTQFRNQICSTIQPLLTCDGNLQIDLESYNGFGNANFSSPLKPDGSLDPSLSNYSPGNPCDVVLLRVFYKWKVITPFIGPLLANMPDDTMLMSATASFRNEPYTSGVAGC